MAETKPFPQETPEAHTEEVFQEDLLRREVSIGPGAQGLGILFS